MAVALMLTTRFSIVIFSGNEKKILTLQCSGSNLDDHWFLTDLGIRPGTTIKAVLIAEVKPVLYIYSAFNEETVPIIDKIPVPRVTVAEVRHRWSVSNAIVFE